MGLGHAVAQSGSRWIFLAGDLENFTEVEPNADEPSMSRTALFVFCMVASGCDNRVPVVMDDGTTGMSSGSPTTAGSLETSGTPSTPTESAEESGPPETGTQPETETTLGSGPDSESTTGPGLSTTTGWGSESSGGSTSWGGTSSSTSTTDPDTDTGTTMGTGSETGTTGTTGQACVDVDRDGWTTCDGDCDDGNPLANPDQDQFFSVPLDSGSFDYNCDGVETYEQPDLMMLLSGYPDCAVQPGWLDQCVVSGVHYDGVPMCGEPGCMGGGYIPKPTGSAPHCSEFPPNIQAQYCN